MNPSLLVIVVGAALTAALGRPGLAALAPLAHGRGLGPARREGRPPRRRAVDPHRDERSRLQGDRRRADPPCGADRAGDAPEDADCPAEGGRPPRHEHRRHRRRRAHVGRRSAAAPAPGRARPGGAGARQDSRKDGPMRCAHEPCARWVPDFLAHRPGHGLAFDEGWYCSQPCLEAETRGRLERAPSPTGASAAARTCRASARCSCTAS